MIKDRTGPRVKVLNWDKTNFEDIEQELAEFVWEMLLKVKN